MWLYRKYCSYSYYLIGGLQTLHGIYPALMASCGLMNTIRLDGFILCAHLYDGKWYLLDCLEAQNSPHNATGTHTRRMKVNKNTLFMTPSYPYQFFKSTSHSCLPFRKTSL